MKLFISWSGERSKDVAIALRDWIPLVLHYVEPWVSDADIEAGERWATTVAEELAVSNFGVICVTPENRESPWLNFEAGALAKSLEMARVVPLLLDVDFAELSGPLSQFQAKKLDQAGVEEIIKSIQAVAPEAVPEDRLRRMLTRLWPDLDESLQKIEELTPSKRRSRPQTEILEELVQSVRAVDSQMRESRDGSVDTELRKPRRFDLQARSVERVWQELGGPGHPVGILLVGSLFKDEQPWLYELALQAHRSVRFGESFAERDLHEFQTALHFAMTIEPTSSASRRYMSTLMFIIESVASTLGTKRST